MSEPMTLGIVPDRGEERPELSRAYRRYLRSPEWRELRRLVLIRDDHRCTACGGTADLEVHHLTYARLGREPLSDLVTTCRACHRAEDTARRARAEEGRRRQRATARRTGRS